MKQNRRENSYLNLDTYIISVIKDRWLKYEKNSMNSAKINIWAELS